VLTKLDHDMPADLVGELPGGAGSRLLVGAGLILILSGLLHIPVWIFDGSDWEGSVSWRKPILFGISTGMTLWSIGWICGAIKRDRFAKLDLVVSFATAVSLVIEVALITLQQWRGAASHFNQATEFDGRIDGVMFVLICIAFLGIVYFGIRSFGFLSLDDGFALAVRSGMVFLILSCIIGFVISSYGYTRIQAGLAPETVGQSGVTKFPHGVAIHVLQILPAIVFLLRKLSVRSDITKQFIWCVSGSFMSLLVFACVQTIAGQARFEMNSWIGYLLLLVAIVILSVPIANTLLSIARNRSFEQILEQSKAAEK